jgi:membrane associated rhomboid family serine protease
MFSSIGSCGAWQGYLRLSHLQLAAITTIGVMSVAGTVSHRNCHAGVFSMFGSHMSAAVRLLRAPKRAIDVNSLSTARKAIKPSIGASGAIYGTFIVTALAVPNATLQFFFLPFLMAPIKWDAAGLIAMDTISIARGWRVMDH